MQMPRFVVSTCSVALMVLGMGVVSGRDYPNKPIRIVTAEPGGLDIVTRLIADGLTGSLGQQVIVDNRGIRAGEIVANAPPDGYTLLAYGGTLWLGPLLQDNAAYDVVRDFAPITWAVASPCILIVHPSLPAKSVKELIALAKARPGALNYGSGITGAITHLAAELFKHMAGVDIVRIPYKGAGPALNALIGGEVQLMFATAPSASPAIKSGRLNAVAVTSAQPSTLFPGLPTIAATGLPGYESVSTLGIFAPVKTHAAMIIRLNQEIRRFLGRADVKEKLFNVGAETVGSSPDELANKIKSEIARMGKVIKAGGIRAE